MHAYNNKEDPLSQKTPGKLHMQTENIKQAKCFNIDWHITSSGMHKKKICYHTCIPTTRKSSKALKLISYLKKKSSIIHTYQ